MKKFVALLAATLLLPLLTGCPTGSQQKKAAQADENVSSVLSAASQSEIAAFNQGQQCLQVATTDVQKASCIVIPQADHDFIQTQFRSVAEAQRLSIRASSQRPTETQESSLACRQLRLRSALLIARVLSA